MWDDLKFDFDEADRELYKWEEEEEEEGEDSGYFPDEDSEKLCTERKTKGCWQPVEMESRPRYSPEAVIEYTKGGAPRSELAVSVKLHLLALGWKIACKEEPPQIRYRYTSPQGRCFYSLCKVCEYLQEQDTSSQSASSCGKDQQHLDEIREEQHSPGTMYQSPSGRENKFSSPVTATEERSIICYSPLAIMKERSPQRSKVFVKPKYSPQAIVVYCMLETSKGKFRNNDPNVDMKQIRLDAKAHLLHDGWHLKYVPKAGRRELRYISPSNKSFASLLTACKSWLENEGKLHAFDKFKINKEPQSNFLFTGNLPGFTPWNEPLGHEMNSSYIEEDGYNVFESTESSSGHKMLTRGKLSQELTTRDKISDTNRPVNGSGNSPPSRYRKISQRRSRRQQSARLCLLIDKGVVSLGQKVRYMQNVNRTPTAEGKITREGIKCDCCSRIYTLSNFEAHAKSSLHRPAAHIFLEDGRSLLDCQMQLDNAYKFPRKKSRRVASIPNGDDESIPHGDNMCSVCHHYGGEFVFCDHCPSCYHLDCIGLKELPEGEWFCPCCRCGICGVGEFDYENYFSDNTVLFCDQCEREFHVSCLKGRGMQMLDSCPKGNWFCSERCSEIFHHLSSLLGISNPTRVEGLSWTIVRSRGINGHFPPGTNAEAFNGFNKKIWAALNVMQECFGSIVDPVTERDLIKDVLFDRGQQLNRLNFQGFYTFVLENKEEMISVATIRVYGEKVAEIPLVCTRFKYRQQGMCRLLMEELEKMLRDIGVERLFLPSIPEMLESWRTKFGFNILTGSERMAFLHHVFLEFQQSIMCQKLLSIPTPSTILTEGGNIEVNEGIEEMDYEQSDVSLHESNGK